MGNSIFKKILFFITFLSFLGAIIFGSDITLNNLWNLSFSWPHFKTIAFNISTGLLASSIMVWGVDIVLMQQNEREDYKKRKLLYTKLTPVLTEFYEFYLYLYIATRKTDVPENHPVLSSLNACSTEFSSQLLLAEPFYKSGYLSDPLKTREQIIAMQSQDPDADKINTCISWYQCWYIASNKFYSNITKIEHDFLLLFPTELLEKLESVLYLASKQTEIIDFIEMTSAKNFLEGLFPVSFPFLDYPTTIILETFKPIETISLLEDVMLYIENDTKSSLRNKPLSFFNGRNTYPRIGQAYMNNS